MGIGKPFHRFRANRLTGLPDWSIFNVIIISEICGFLNKSKTIFYTLS